MKAKVKLNVELKQYPKDTVLTIEVDDYGTPIDRYWRKRFLDSKIDNCIEFINDTKSVKKAIKKEVSE